MKRAYEISVREFIVVADDEREVREWVAECARDGNFVAKVLTPEELREWGETYPVGNFDPDRELTCAEIAYEMEKAKRPAPEAVVLDPLAVTRLIGRLSTVLLLLALPVVGWAQEADTQITHEAGGSVPIADAAPSVPGGGGTPVSGTGPDAPAPLPLAAATYAELSATSTQVTGLGAEAQNYIGGQFLAQAGFGPWAVATRARWEGLPAEYKSGEVQTYRTAEAYLSGHLNLLSIQSVTCGPSVTAGYAVALDKGHPSFAHNMTGQVGIHCASGGRTVLVQAGSWQPLPGVAGTVAVIWPLGEHISWHGDYGVGARGSYVARVSVAVQLKAWGKR